MAHVLLIDDDEDLVEGNRAALAARGFRVSFAYSGHDGWRAVEELRPDVVVLDCMMEEVTSGFELAHDIAVKHPRLPILMLTGVHEHMNADWKFGPSDRNWLPIHRWMEKPLPPSRLVEAIEDLLRLKASAQ